MMDDDHILWYPDKNFIGQSNLTIYRKWLKANKGLEFSGYEELWAWSSDQLSEFWESIWQFFNIIHEQSYSSVVDSHRMPGAQWFSGSRLNYAEHLFRHENPDRPAIIFAHENGTIEEIPWANLRKKVSVFQRTLIHLGVREGDRVAVVMPNIPETIVAFMAVNSLGAIWSCCSPDFGATTIFERFSQIEPKLLITVDGYWYNQKAFNRIEEIKWLQKEIKSIENTVLLPYLDPGSALNQAIPWPTIDDDSNILFNRVPFAHSIWILYSSGTTGKPKAITHSHGGVLLEHLKYLSLHNDVKSGENFFWFSTTGWMMWNFLQASLLVGATPVLYDGSPALPDLKVLWKLSEQLPIHHFGTSAPYLIALMKSGIRPGEECNLKDLRSIGSTGAPLPSEVFSWIYEGISSKVWLCSMSGGTDVCTAFAGGCPEKPVISGRIQCRALGCAMVAYDDSGVTITGKPGEMVIEKPMPSMPVYFWNDDKNQRYISSYFEEFPGKWRHGDFLKIFDDGSLIIQGRSDATLNRKGVRIGTAEIYNILDDFSELKDSLIINIDREDGTDFMPLFIVLNKEIKLSESLKEKINNTLKKKCSPRHVPDVIKPVPDIPYTLSGKKMEVPVKRLFLKNQAQKKPDLGTIRNPEAMKYFIKLAEEL